MGREIEKEYWDHSTGKRIKEIWIPADYGRTYNVSRYVYDYFMEMWLLDTVQYVDAIYAKETGMAIHDDKTNKNFGMAFPCKYCDKGYHATEAGLLDCQELHLIKSALIPSRDTSQFAPDDMVMCSAHGKPHRAKNFTHECAVGGTDIPVTITTASGHNWNPPRRLTQDRSHWRGGNGGRYPEVTSLGGGPGGSGRTISDHTTTISYREAGLNTTVQSVEGTTISGTGVISAPAGIVLVDGATYTGDTRYRAFVSSGCGICDGILLTEETRTQSIYELWYKHYLQAGRRGDTDFAIRHLEFIMKHMLDYVGPDTKPVYLPQDCEPTKAVVRAEERGVNIAGGILTSIVTCVTYLAGMSIFARNFDRSMSFTVALVVSLVLSVISGFVFYRRLERKDRKKNEQKQAKRNSG